LHSTASTKLAPPENRQGHANGAVVVFCNATPDCFPAYCFLLFKRAMASYVKAITPLIKEQNGSKIEP
jgi:hypothetical protein